MNIDQLLHNSTIKSKILNDPNSIKHLGMLADNKLNFLNTFVLKVKMRIFLLF